MQVIYHRLYLQCSLNFLAYYMQLLEFELLIALVASSAQLIVFISVELCVLIDAWVKTDWKNVAKDFNVDLVALQVSS